ncbi:hypothetical protein [Vibrio marisflavi]|uniref:Uncharacterized protein n=1 Tax=Vibrio marisflavi CECT 7928 TaxID=634439 RepID=A0ABN8E911_9VIBR|nr:hypothetical protein [Vibrio marisflavi]CAH0542985.1 hypothetical protein VMF7928_04346 [Vibrio marisflavi CECT 7928]
MDFPNIRDIKKRLASAVFDKSSSDAVTVDKTDLAELLIYLSCKESKLREKGFTHDQL